MENRLLAYENRLLKLEKDDGDVIGNFKGVREKAMNIEARSYDFTVQAQDLIFKPDPSHGINVGILSKDGVSYPVTSWALGQICNSMDVNVAYARKCINQGEPQMITDHLNYWLKRINQEKGFLLRSTDHMIHGFMSGLYGIFDDATIVSIIEDRLPKDQFVVKNASISPEYINVRIVCRDTIKTADGDDLHIAINVKNSRVGMSGFVVQFMLYKWICSNGVLFGGGSVPLFKRKHVGDIAASAKYYFSEAVGNIPTMTRQIEEIVGKAKTASLNQEAFEKIMLQIQAAKLPNLTEKVIETLPNYRGGMTMMNVVNALTEVAQGYNNDTRDAIEMFSGKILQAV